MSKNKKRKPQKGIVKQMKKGTKEEKGITLVALVVTIIILLILAGVTVYFAVNGGLIGKVEEAVDKSNQAGQSETNVLNQAVAEIDKYLNGTGGTTTPEEEMIPKEKLINIEYEFDESLGAITAIKNKASYYKDNVATLPGGDTLIIPSQINGVTVKSIGDFSKNSSNATWVFHGCSNLKTLIIPNTITNLGPYVLGVSNTVLTTIKYTGSREQWDVIDKGAGNDWIESRCNIIYDYTYRIGE